MQLYLIKLVQYYKLLSQIMAGYLDVTFIIIALLVYSEWKEGGSCYKEDTVWD